MAANGSEPESPFRWICQLLIGCCDRKGSHIWRLDTMDRVTNPNLRQSRGQLTMSKALVGKATNCTVQRTDFGSFPDYIRACGFFHQFYNLRMVPLEDVFLRWQKHQKYPFIAPPVPSV